MFTIRLNFRFLWLAFLAFFFPTTAFGEGLSVAVTIFPLQEFAQAVGGERAKVLLLLPPGAEPHTWEPKPSDIVRISRADVFISIGATMEPWVPEIMKAVNNPGLEKIEASEGLPLIAGVDDDHGHTGGSAKSNQGGKDPHVWLEFTYDESIVDRIVAAFTKKDPGNADYYRRNGEAYKKKLIALDRAYRHRLTRCESKTIVLASHAAFGYLAKRYGLIQVPLYGVSPDSEPTPKTMANVIALARQHRVRAIYYEELVSDKLAKAIAGEVGAKPLILNAGHNVTRTQIDSGITFLSLMEKNLENLAYGLGCK